MGFRFYKSIRLGKFLRLNISKSGISLSAGVPGLGISTGQRGSQFHIGLPGTGLSYRKKMASGHGVDHPAGKPQAQSAPPPSPPELPSPGLLASREEKELAAGLAQYHSTNPAEALDHFLNATTEEPGAALLAATLLAERPGGEDQAIKLLERVIANDDEFPTPLMAKYLSSTKIEIDVTPNITVSVPADGLAATLLLVELYQSKGRIDEAIGLLEEVEELAGDPVLTLSLAELYAVRGIWDGIIERAKNTENKDDITLATIILYGQAMEGKGLHEAAIDVFTKVLRITRQRSPRLLNEARYWRALAYEAAGKRSRANQELQKLYADAPDFRDVARLVEKFKL